jgi:hypothetical protein
VILDLPSVPHYLIAMGLATTDEVIGGRYEVVETTYRNLGFRVQSELGRSYYVKQARLTERGNDFRLLNEGFVLNAIWSNDDMGKLRCISPVSVRLDRQRLVLVTELLPHPQLDPQKLDTRTELPAALARTLSMLHSVTGADLNGLHIHNGGSPGVLSIGKSDGPQLDSRARSEIARIVQADARFQSLLDHLEASWNPRCLTHGDVKWSNILYSGSEMRLVDWETSAIGEAEWDLAGVAASYLSSWAAAGTADSLESVLAHTRRFWATYILHAPVQADPERAAGLLCARLVQTAYERSSLGSALDPPARVLLKLALSYASDSAMAGNALFKTV